MIAQESTQPFKIGIQFYLANRVEEGLSPAAVGSERKAIRSQFSPSCARMGFIRRIR